MLPYALRHKGRIVAALIALFVASAATLVVPISVRKMIDFGFSDANGGVIRVYFIAMLVVVAVLAIASGARYYLVMTLGERVVADLRSDLFAHLTRLDPGFFDAEKTGEIASRLSADTTQLKATFGSTASIALRNLFMFVGAIGMMVVTSAKLSAFVLAAIPIIVLPLFAAGRAVRQRSRRAQDTLADATAFATESLSAVRVMQSFVAEDFTAKRYRDAAYGAYEAARSMSQARGIVTAAALFLAFGSVVIVLWLGAQDVVAGRISGGVRCSSSSTPCSARARSGNCPRCGTTCRRPPAPRSESAISWRSSRASRPRPSRPCWRGRFAARWRSRSVDFAYPGREEDSVLRDMSSVSRPAKSSPSSAHRERESRRCSSWPCASTIRREAR